MTKVLKSDKGVEYDVDTIDGIMNAVQDKALTMAGGAEALAHREGRIAAAAAAKAAAEATAKALYCKVAWAGGLSVYGLQRMPVTLFVNQWERLFAFVPGIKEFIAKNVGVKQQREKDGVMVDVCLTKDKPANVAKK